MGQVAFQFTSDDKDVVKSLEKMTAAMQRLKDENKRLREETKQTAAAGKEMTDEYGEWLATTIKGGVAAVAGYASVTSALRYLNDELKRRRDLQNEVAESQKKVAEEERKFLINLGNVDAGDRSAAISTVKRLSAKTGVEMGAMYQAASTAEGARGGTSRKGWESALEAAGRVAPHNIGELTATAGGLLDLVSVTGSERGIANVGFMAGMGSQTRISNLEMINKNLVPAAIGVKQFGGSAGQAAGLVDTLTQLKKDQTGATSGTGALALAEALSQFYPENDRFEFDEKGRRKLAAKGTGLTDTVSRLQRLNADPREQERFMAKHTFEKEIKPFITQLVRGGDAGELLKSNIASFPTTETDLATAGERFVAGLNATPLQKQAGTARALGTAIQHSDLDKLRLGSDVDIANKTVEALKKSGVAGGMGGLYDSLKYHEIMGTAGLNVLGGRGDTPVMRAMTSLREREMELEGTRPSSSPAFGLFDNKSAEEKQADLQMLKEIRNVLIDIHRERSTNINAHGGGGNGNN